MSAREVLLQLGPQHVRLWAEGERLRYLAPKGAMTAGLRRTIERHKPGLVRLLGQVEGVLGMTLMQFEDARCYLEVQVSGLEHTLWFVPGDQDADRLVGEGTARGRIWTAQELRKLTTLRGVTKEDALAIAKSKLTFDGTVTDVQPSEAASGASGSPDLSMVLLMGKDTDGCS